MFAVRAKGSTQRPDTEELPTTGDGTKILDWAVVAAAH